MQRRLLNQEARTRRLAVASISLLGVFLLLYFTRTGATIRGDSVRYVMGAENLLLGNGYARTSGGGEIYPETGFAPLLSFVLAFFGFLKLDMYSAGRAMNVVLFGINIYLVGSLLARYTRSTIVAVLGSLAFIFIGDLFEWHGWLMSEPLYIFLTLVSLTALLRSLDTGSWSSLLVSAVAAGFSSLARYIGVSFIPAGMLALLLFDRGGWRQKVIRAFTFGFVASAPFIGWMIRNQLVGEAGVANREIIFHPMRPELVRLYLFQLTSWFIPDTIVLPRALRAVIALVLAGAAPAAYLVQRWTKRWQGQASRSSQLKDLSWVLLLFIPAYGLVLLLNSFFLDAGTTYEGVIRYLTPLLGWFILLEFAVIADLLQSVRSRWVNRTVAAYFAFVLVLGIAHTLSVANASTNQFGFTGLRTRPSDLIEQLKTLDPSIPLITDNPEMIYYLIDRPAYMKPIKYDLYQQTDREDYEEQLALAKARLAAGSVFVLFGAPSDEEQEILRRLKVRTVFSSGDTTIYALDQ